MPTPPDRRSLFLTRRLPPAVEARAESDYDVRRVTRDGGPALVPPGTDAVLCTPADPMDARAIAALPGSVRAIGTFSVGFDHIDLQAARARSIVVVNTPGVLSEATAEFTMLLILAAARHACQAERKLRQGERGVWLGATLPGRQVSFSRLGIFGMGRIGQALARMAAGFEMPLHYRNRTRLPPDLERDATYHDSDAGFLAQCDVLAICAPASQATRHWLNADRIALLPPGAIVVNTARGSLVDDEALAEALRTGRVAAAGLDVFPHEPEVPPAYLALENVVLTPHIASATVETRNAMGFLALDGIGDVLAGREPRCRVI